MYRAFIILLLLLLNSSNKSHVFKMIDMDKKYIYIIFLLNKRSINNIPDSVSLQELQSSIDHLVLVALSGIVQSCVAQGGLQEECTNITFNHLNF